MENSAHLMHAYAVTSPLLDADGGPGVVQSALALPPRAVTAVSGRFAQLACAVAVAPFAILTVLFLGPDSL